MRITAIRRIENRSSASVTVFDRENEGAAGSGRIVSPNSSADVNMWVPWAESATAFDLDKKHLEVQLNGTPRYWIWQAFDFVRYAIQRTWKETGEHVQGYAGQDGDRRLIVFDDRIAVVSRSLGETVIKRVENWTTGTLSLHSFADAGSPGNAWPIPGNGGSRSVSMTIPVAESVGEFGGHKIEVRDVNSTVLYSIWQSANADGDFVRFSTDGAWRETAERVDGTLWTGGARTLLIWPEGMELVDFSGGLPAFVAELRAKYDLGGFSLDPGGPPASVPSVPKTSAVAFSIAGPPSDALDQGQPGARFLYRDSGKRYEFRIRDGVLIGSSTRNGVVVAVDRDGVETPLTTALSFSGSRVAQPLELPEFDLVAASGNRVFAKEKGTDRFFFAMMDHPFIHWAPGRGEFPIPNMYSKLDPEFNKPTAQPADLINHLAGAFAGHYATERFPLFRWVFAQNLMDFMNPRFVRRQWHLVDPRTPLGMIHPLMIALEWLEQRHGPWDIWYALLSLFLGRDYTVLDFLGVTGAVKDQLRRQLERAKSPGGTDPPSWVPHLATIASYSNGTTTLPPKRGVAFYRVLDIGVAALHMHDQYERVSGGELQSQRTHQLTYAWRTMYQYFNGPLQDADGFNDGTCNYYVLAQLKTDAELALAPGEGDDVLRVRRRDAYGLIYMDEQTYFSQRWRLVHPEDYRGAMATVVAETHGAYDGTAASYDPYQFKRDFYWCPFRGGRIGPRSRLAAAGQVLLVTGDPVDGAVEIYSINFTHSTMDRTWRRRALPAAPRYFESEAALRDETITPPPGGGDCVYPQTIRLREDMTIHLKGTRGGVVGRWYQRYLPATNQAVPAGNQLVQPPEPSTCAALHLEVDALVADRNAQIRELERQKRMLDPNDPSTPADRAEIDAQIAVLKAEIAAAQTRLADMGCRPYPSPIGPEAAYGHPWKFLAEPVFRRADRFSHLGVYDEVDSRTQYYIVTPETPADEQALVAGQSGRWVDSGRQLYTGAWKFSYTGPFGDTGVGQPGGGPSQHRRPPSMFNPDTYLRVVRRGSFGWIAMLWDKRDDDLVPIDRQMPVTLRNDAGGRARVSLRHPWYAGGPPWGRLEEPPVVRKVVFSWLTDGAYRLAITLTSPLDLRALDFDRALRRGAGAPDDKLVFENVWRVRIAAFVPPPSAAGAPPPGVSLLDVIAEQRFVRTGAGSFEYRCVLTAEETAALAPYCSVSAGPLHGTSIWFEDVGGHVSAPEEVQWFPAMPPALYVTQSLPVQAAMISGRTYWVSVTMRNTGVETWTTAAGVKLGSQSPQDNTTWGTARVALPGPVAPDATVTFSFPVTAPSVAQSTTASFQWRMVKEFVEWFGEFTPHVVVQIVSLKEAVRVAAYYIGQKRGRGPGDWVSDWYAARVQLGIPPNVFV